MRALPGVSACRSLLARALPDTPERAAATVALPMYGVNHSFPVAVTVGMVLGEWGRRHYAPGSLHPRPRRREPV